MNEYALKSLTEAVKRYTEIEHILRTNPQSWSSCAVNEFTAEGQEYLKQSADYRAALAELWMATDCEYDSKDPVAAACWEWRYWSVMARKCCWSQLTTGKTDWAAETMQKLDEAGRRLLEVLGLQQD